MPIPSPRVSEVVNKDGANPKQVRISKKVREAIDFMVLEGLSRKEAAEKADLKDNSLYIALRKPEVLALMRERMGDLRKSAAAVALGQVAKLSTSAQSDHVKLQASQFLLGIEGVSPRERVDHSHTHVHLPGYVLDPGAFDDRRPERFKDVTSGAQQIANLADGEGQAADSCADVPETEKGTGGQGDADGSA